MYPVKNGNTMSQHRTPNTAPAARVSLGRGLELQSPILLASGTASYGEELCKLCNFSTIGGLVTKAISLEPRAGNPPQRIAETRRG